MSKELLKSMFESNGVWIGSSWLRKSQTSGLRKT